MWDGKIFYIGSGIMSRPFSRKDRNKRWLEFVREHPSYEVRIVAQYDILAEARSDEAAQIKQHRPVCNGKDKSERKSNGTSVISIRVSDEWLAAVDAVGARLRLKRNAVIVNFIWDAFRVAKFIENQGPPLIVANGEFVCGPVVQAVEKSVQAVEDAVAHDFKDHRRPGKGCSECGSLTGHQKGCKKRK